MAASTSFGGRHTTVGNSEALRFDKQLFRQHKEFGGAVEARVIGPGVMLVTAVGAAPVETEEHEDPMLVAWLTFLASDGSGLRDLDEDLLREAAELTRGIHVSDDEVLDVDL